MWWHVVWSFITGFCIGWTVMDIVLLIARWFERR